MLAHPGSPADLEREHFIWSPKLDGVRCVAHIDEHGVTLINRNQRDIGHRYPDIVAAITEQVHHHCVLDGELVALDTEGKPSFSLIAQRDSVSKPAKIAAAVAAIPAQFMVFDVLATGGEDLRTEPLAWRQTVLETISEKWRAPLMRVENFEDGRTLWSVVCAQGLEGVVGKDRRSRYTGKRDRTWLKVKCLQRVSCVVTGYEPGEGARAGTIGALLLSMFDPLGQLVPVGRCGTGFNARSLAECKELLDNHQPFIAEIECLSLGTLGQLRHPSFKGIRTDLSPADVTTAQLDTLPRT